jgi:hypothetical protein
MKANLTAIDPRHVLRELMRLTQRYTYLEGDVVVHGIELAGVDVGGSPSVVSLDQMDPDAVVEQPD